MVDEKGSLVFMCTNCKTRTYNISSMRPIPHAFRFYWTCVGCSTKCWITLTLEQLESYCSENKLTEEDKKFLGELHIVTDDKEEK